MAAIDTDGLTRRFGEFVAVEDLSMTVEEGEVFGFLGPNGAGKSTTINVLLGFLDPSEGSATILGHDVTTDSRAIRERIGLLPEGYDVYENLTGREHVVSAIDTTNADDDPDHLAYHEFNRERGRLPGALRIRVRYKRHATPWFDYLMVSPEELRAVVEPTVWELADVVAADEGPQYYAELRKE